MKNLLIALAVLIFGLTSCNTYEEGPYLSLQSKEKRIANTWVVDYVKNAEGEDVTDQYDDQQWIFSEDGDVEYSGEILGVEFEQTGLWSLVDDEQGLQITLDDLIGSGTSSTTSTILRLTQDELWLRTSDDDEVQLKTF